MKIALVGATGLVGTVMIKVLEEMNFPCTEFIPAASERSVGKTVTFRGKEHTIVSLQNAVDARPALAIFSAGGSVSKQWAEKFAANGTYVVDNSSAWRMDEHVPLVVPEVNAHALKKDTLIIANPNCSTIQMVLALAPLHKAYGIRRLVVSTYQSVTGTGMKAVKQMEDERAGIEGEKAYPHPIDLNCFPHGGDFSDNGYTTEELKLLNETRKILDAPELKVTATVVRIPVVGGHSEAINVEFERDFDLGEVRKLLEDMPGIVVKDDPASNLYPMPLTAQEKNEVFVGRLRRDTTIPYGLDLWVVADNLRKGAATNAIQIAFKLLEKRFIQ
ncbi:MAG: aspartate-semialdehyde dehydrogenase [Bacteroides sp.]|jgi:aspartate-semialdehyde dehydrogenase|nr:aspartate-semialdehyde dehydrogenase [Bacteroides sp.]